MQVINSLQKGVFVLFKKIGEAFSWKELPGPEENGSNLAAVLEQAHREWRHAKLYFNCVTDPDLIDHAIFYLGASEKKYIYLLKQARETGLNTEKFYLSE